MGRRWKAVSMVSLRRLRSTAAGSLALTTAA